MPTVALAAGAGMPVQHVQQATSNKQNSFNKFLIALLLILPAQFASALSNEDFGDPLAINFGLVGPDLVVTEVLVDVRNRWLCNDKFFVDIEISGFNAGPHAHGLETFNVSDEAEVFDEFKGHSEVVFDFTADEVNQAHNEDYTVCVQPKKWKEKTQQFKLFGEPHCQVFESQ